LKNIPYNIAIGNATDVGKLREHNEDYMAHFDTPLGYCILVCDGMGGHAAGEVASQNAVEAIRHFLQNGKITLISTPTSLRNAIEFANFKLRGLVDEKPELKGMGTTCILALIKDADLYVAHAGDSRLYLIRDKKIIQLSKDHSTVQKLIDRGILTEEEALRSEKKHEITKAIGIFEKVGPSVSETPIALLHNDKLLLCSDGLTAHVTNKVINEIINVNPDLQVAAMRLVEIANKGGGSDNITVQIIHYTGKSSKKQKKRGPGKLLIAFLIIILLAAAGIYNYKTAIIRKSDAQSETVPSAEKLSETYNSEDSTSVSDNSIHKKLEDHSATKKDKRIINKRNLILK
jgi:serine/threonine protein phosphatase PrpC